MLKALTVILFLAVTATTALCADPIEGRWSIGHGRAVVEIVSNKTAGTFEMRWLDGDDCSILPGTIVGNISAAPTPGLYDCQMPLDPLGSSKPRIWEAAIIIDEHSPYNFTFRHYERRKSVNIRHMLPRWLRITITDKNTRPDNLDGATRLDAPPAFVRL